MVLINFDGNLIRVIRHDINFTALLRSFTYRRVFLGKLGTSSKYINPSFSDVNRLLITKVVVDVGLP